MSLGVIYGVTHPRVYEELLKKLEATDDPKEKITIEVQIAAHTFIDDYIHKSADSLIKRMDELQKEGVDNYIKATERVKTVEGMVYIGCTVRLNKGYTHIIDKSGSKYALKVHRTEGIGTGNADECIYYVDLLPT